MKKLYFQLTLIIAFAFNLTQGQSPQWRWATQANASFEYTFNCVSPVSNGVFYVTGIFQGTHVVLGNDTVTVSDSSIANFFVAKYDTGGHVIWARGVSDHGFSVFGRTMTLGSDGSVYIAGQFDDSIVTLGAYTLNAGNSYPYQSYFIVKYDPSGNLIWAQTAVGSPFIESMCTDVNGDIYVTGQTGGGPVNMAAFGGDTVQGNMDYYLVKYNPQGNVKWVRGANSSNNGAYVATQPLASDSLGNVFVPVWFQDSIAVFGNDTVYGSTHFTEQCLVKYDTSGNVIWARIPQGYAYGQDALSATANGNLYWVGSYDSAIIVGTDTFYSPSIGYFLAKYNSGGQVVWALNLPNNLYATALSTDAAGSVYVGASFVGTIIFGSDTLSAGNAQISLVLKYDSLGNAIWAKAVTGSYNAIAWTINLDADENIYIGGDFEDTIQFAGADTLINPLGTTHTIFLACLSQCAGVAPLITTLGTDTLTTGVFASYQWLLNGAPITNATGRNYVPTQNGDYQVEVTAAGGCRGTSAVSHYTADDIPEIKGLEDIRLYPNPGNGTFILETENSIGSKYTVYSTLGSVINTSVITVDKQTLDLSYAAPGVYNVVVKVNGVVYSRKVVIVK